MFDVAGPHLVLMKMAEVSLLILSPFWSLLIPIHCCNAILNFGVNAGEALVAIVGKSVPTCRTIPQPIERTRRHYEELVGENLPQQATWDKLHI